MNKEEYPVITGEELKVKMEEAVTPIDFEALIEKGVLEKRRGWYKVNKLSDLPEHAKAKIRKTKSTNEGLFVQFRAPSKRLAKMLGKF
jgi:hypothetical protein